MDTLGKALQLCFAHCPFDLFCCCCCCCRLALSDCSFAEMDKSIKNVISHRARAIEQVKTYFKKLDETEQ